MPPFFVHRKPCNPLLWLALAFASPASMSAPKVPAASAPALASSSELLKVVIPSDPCRIDVAKFERSIGFVRQSQGNKAADELREKLLPAQLQNAILSEQGYCGLAKYLNEKKLLK